MHEAALNILAIKPSLSQQTVKTSQPCSRADLDACCWHTIPQLRCGIIPVRGIRPWEETEKNVISRPGPVCYRGPPPAASALVQGSLDDALQNGHLSLKILLLMRRADASVLGHTGAPCLGSRVPLCSVVQCQARKQDSIESIILPSGAGRNDLFYWGLCARHTNVLHK